MCVFVPEGDFSESIGCDGGGCIVTLSRCDAEAGSLSEITDRPGAARSCVPGLVCAPHAPHISSLCHAETSLSFLLPAKGRAPFR